MSTFGKANPVASTRRYDSEGGDSSPSNGSDGESLSPSGETEANGHDGDSNGIVSIADQRRDLPHNVDIENIALQLARQKMAAGISFNLLVVGDTGLGKTTLVDTLFNTDFALSELSHPIPVERGKSQGHDADGLTETILSLTQRRREIPIDCSSVLHFTLVETSGFGEQTNDSDSVETIVNYIEARHFECLEEELKVTGDKSQWRDTRIHACFYLIPPTGHSLRPIDLVALKALAPRVNLIPIVAKSDMLTHTEICAFKRRIMDEISRHNIHLFDFVELNSPENSTRGSVNQTPEPPFAVVGSVETSTIGDRVVRARIYPWGTVQVDNASHCDSCWLQKLLTTKYLYPLITSTDRELYEDFRNEYLVELGFSDSPTGYTIERAYEEELARQIQSMKVSEEKSKENFMTRVKQAQNQLKEREKEIQAAFEELKEKQATAKAGLKIESDKIEEERRDLEKKILRANELITKESLKAK